MDLRIEGAERLIVYVHLKLGLLAKYYIFLSAIIR